MKRADLTGFALDLGGTKTAAARIENGTVIERVQTNTEGAFVVERHLDIMAELLEKVGHTKAEPLGVAVTGRVTQEGNWHSVNHGTLTQIDNAPLGNALKERFGSGYLCNDATAASVAEFHFGAGRQSENFAYITVSTGVGGGLIVNGRPIQSNNGLAGHIGFISTPLGNDLCGSGRNGTVESVAGGRAIAAAAAKAGHHEMDARAVFAVAAQGEGWAIEIIDRSANAIAILCSDLTAMLGLDNVALGGSIGLAAGYTQKVITHLALEPALFHVAICNAELDQNSPLIGALALHYMRGNK
ncbi:ROK family protein [Ahrensia sp. 13_GOM-1096m]|uniref:ROK family protein n=1 Tax=Ahrensia sp. 13_GOM-1096m TaxID=1380380 RepID=UPI00047EC173|nr:ROK family protein [Ahrensia sp. 13_GOM-1096m]